MTHFFKIPVLKNIKTQRNKRRLLQAGILLASGGLFTLLVALIQPFYTFNLWFSDQFLSSGTASPNIVIAGIDDETLSDFGKWSDWPRTLHAQAVENLKAAGATVVGIDILFADSSNNDDLLADALQNSGNVVLAGSGTNRISNQGAVVTFKDFLLPAADLYQACSNVGHVNIVPDPDGKVRRIPLIVQEDNHTYPSLSMAILFTLFHIPLPADFPVVDNKLNILMRDIPVESYFMRLNYAVAESDPVYISYGDIIKNDFDASLVKNKIVLIGMTATGDIDTWSVPNSAVRVPGIYLHAAAIDTILRTQFLTEISLNTTLLIMLLLVLTCAVILPFFGTWKWTDVLKGTGLISGLLIVYILVCSVMAGNGYIMNVLYPSLVLTVIFITHILYMIIREQRDKRFVKELFGRYVSPEISREIVSLANDGRLKLGGEEREVTVLFADIRNFTSISEQMTPEDVVKMLNTCMPVMIEAIVRNGGLVNKFAGDNLMGVWNAPKYRNEHARLAVKASLEAQTNMMALAETNPLVNNIRFGIGINTGKALAGNIGSMGRVEYTVIGDEVNLASRICSSTPGGFVHIGPQTYLQVKTFFTMEVLEPQIFKGKTKPIPIYRVTGILSSS